jgi:hypothetical protein
MPRIHANRPGSESGCEVVLGRFSSLSVSRKALKRKQRSGRPVVIFDPYKDIQVVCSEQIGRLAQVVFTAREVLESVASPSDDEQFHACYTHCEEETGCPCYRVRKGPKRIVRSDQVLLVWFRERAHGRLRWRFVTGRIRRHISSRMQTNLS